MENKKRIVVALVLLLVLSFSLFAERVPNRGAVGYVNYAGWYDYENDITDTANYIPGLRLEGFLTKNWGVSADALLLYTEEDFDGSGKPLYLMMFMVNGIFRVPLGIVEPYVAAGPIYLGAFTEGASEVSDSFGLNIRGGVDFNILKWLSVGIEANYFVDDFKELIDNADYYFSLDGLKQSSLIGVSLKFKF
ncbi:MAG: outer membrane beta-barrel protein [Sphaerochaetaceae bacterium]